MAGDLTLSVLDLCKLYHGQLPQEVIWESVELAPRLERLGCRRYWLAEHHAHDTAHGSPELLAAVLAGVTDKMRIGTAGVLLRLYSPYKVAENFRLLHTLFPGRIDMGIARGYVSPARESALMDGSSQAEFAQKVSNLLDYVRGIGEISANPTRTPPPEIWMLGSRTTSAKLAAEHGTAFSFALFLDPGDGPPAEEVLAQYRQEFRPVDELKEPKWSIALAGICAATEEEARALMPSGETGVTANIVGTPRMWRETIEHLRDKTGTSEFTVLSLCGGVESRYRCFEMIYSELMR